MKLIQIISLLKIVKSEVNKEDEILLINQFQSKMYFHQTIVKGTIHNIPMYFLFI